jgi:hypothetical protein
VEERNVKIGPRKPGDDYRNARRPVVGALGTEGGRIPGVSARHRRCLDQLKTPFRKDLSLSILDSPVSSGLLPSAVHSTIEPS